VSEIYRLSKVPMVSPDMPLMLNSVDAPPYYAAYPTDRVGLQPASLSLTLPQGDPRQNSNPALSSALMNRYLETIKQASSNKRIKLSSSSPCEVSDLSQENGNGEGNRSEQHSDNNFYQNSRPGSSDQSPLQSPRAPKTEVNSDASAAVPRSPAVSNTMRFATSTHAAWPTVLNPQTAAAYQLQQQNAFIQAVGADKNLKELAIFTEQHNNAQLLGYTPVSSAQLNGNRPWPNIPVVGSLHGTSNGDQPNDYQNIVARDGMSVPGLNPDEQLVAEERLFPPMPDAPGIPNGAKE